MTDEQRVGPALSPEEWAGAGSPGIDGIVYAGNLEWRGVVPLHALAALCLYQQPFGFTHDDVEFLRIVERSALHDMPGWTDRHGGKGASLAARIAALLPPSDSP